jgi:hypothetical protein
LRVKAMGPSKASVESRWVTWRTLAAPAVGGLARDGPAEGGGACVGAWAAALPAASASGAAAAPATNCLRLAAIPVSLFIV